MFNWLRELIEIKRELAEIRNESIRSKIEIKTDEQICKSCETLRQQLEIANYEKNELLHKLLKDPEPIPVQNEPVKITRPRMLPWNVRRQILEKEDREKAKLMRTAPKPISEVKDDTERISTEELEKELEIVEDARQTEGQK